ncbi:polysaccharide biosynthesis/export family protein [Agarivorans aestuarii]|uniref:Polysaccharide biosynthesis/export family protein n=1 Tax=Agarivorans aestuarii TaxID=1563703 RepID=A0ABU7G0D4_9ALTE|nr:polysaccharide biosynthesis/export family protein [Agarivorans aestuarii]MEE1672671.1 polysaccharide biosynthesis/export family protein [Agarivorans aestuarii]
MNRDGSLLAMWCNTKHAWYLLVTLLMWGGFSAASQANELEQSYRLGAGDRIQIVVYGESDLSMELLVTNSGKIDYPYLGRIPVNSLTAQQLRDNIEQGLRGDYLINPKVAVNIIGYRQIFINGEVEHPGGYAYQPGLTVEKAIALAGGFTERASKTNINITPGNGTNDLVKAALKHRIAPGDIIVVKASFF